MAKFSTKRVEVEAEQWMPGKPVVGVVEETKVATGSEPEVTHGLLLVPGYPPLQLKEKAKVGDRISCGRGHLDLPNGNTLCVRPGEWIVRHGDEVFVLSNGDFLAKYESAT